MSPPVQVEVTAPLATVRLDVPDRRKGLSAEDWRSLAQAFTGLSERSDVACVVLRGTGGGAFAGGADASSRASKGDDPEIARADAEAIAAALSAVRACRHPTVAVIEGICVGAGLEIAACCDLRVCGESSRFGAPIRRLDGAGPTTPDGPEPLMQLLGGSSVLEVLSSGELIDARLAHTVGLVNRVHPDRTVVEQGYGLAARIAAGAPLVNRWHKSFVRRLHERAPLGDAESAEASAGG